MTTVKKGVIELIELNLETFRPYKSQLSKEQLDDFNRLESALDILKLGSTIDSMSFIQAPE